MNCSEYPRVWESGDWPGWRYKLTELAPPMIELSRQGLDATQWLIWCLETEQRAVNATLQSLAGQLGKAAFWQRWSATPLSKRQVSVLQRLLDGFEGKLTSGLWAAMADCSPDTALRDINALVACGVLRKTATGGRSTSYELITAVEP